MAASRSEDNHNNKGWPFRLASPWADYCDNSAERWLLPPVKRANGPKVTSVCKPNEKLFRLLGCSSLYVNSPSMTKGYLRPDICYNYSINSWVFFSSTGCGSVINNTLKSPYYPMDYPGSVDCVYRVPIPGGMALKIFFQDFFLENPTSWSRW